MSQDRFSPYICYQGAFRITASRFQHLRAIDFATFPRNNTVPQRSDNLTFSFTVFAEPRMPLLGVNDVNLTAAYDNENNSLVPSPDPPSGPDGGGQKNRMSRYGSGQRMTSSPAEVTLSRPSAKATVAKLLRGTVSLTLLADQKPEVVTEKLMTAKNQKAKIGTTTIVIEEVSETPTKQFQVKLSVTEEDAGNDYTWSNSLYYRMEVQDEKGQKLQNYGSSWSTNGSNHVRITLTFGQGGGNPNPGKPAKLIYHVWTTLQHRVQFEFQDLPLP
jgi:hypothetical protein